MCNRRMPNQMNLNFELTVDEANAILAALQELPAKICNPLSEKLKQQAAPQIAAAAAKPDTAAE